jgi:hypothetical protein
MNETSNARSSASTCIKDLFVAHSCVTDVMLAHLDEAKAITLEHSKSQHLVSHLIYADGEIKIGPDHSTWTRQCIYIIMARGQTKPILYIGQAGKSRARLSPRAKSNTLGHEKFGQAVRSFHQVAVFALEVENLNVETQLIKHFDPVMNRADAPHWQREKQRRRVDQILKKIEEHPGITFSDAILGIAWTTGSSIIEDLVETRRIDRQHGTSRKTGRPCCYLYPALSS